MFEVMKISNKPAYLNVKKDNKVNDKVINYDSKLLIGTGSAVGLTALATVGIYIANRKSQNIEKVFETVKIAPSIIETFKTTKLKPNSFKSLLFKITSDEKTSEKFIQEVVSNPRKSKENVRVLNQKIGGDKELIDWMLRPNGYQEAYQKYIQKLFNNAEKPDDLMKISPNWSIWKIKEKFKDDFTIGELPKEFGGTDSYRSMFEKSFQGDSININGVHFGNYFSGGLSGKGVRKVEVGDKKYILKFQSADMKYSDPNFKDDISMKSDSTFLNAQLDRYLSLNNCSSSPQLKFFDYKTNSALYEITEGVSLETKQIQDILDVNKKLDDINSLGVYYNDINNGNFLIKDNKLLFIDSGESSFVDFFKPGVSGFHFALPNLNGKSITDSAAAIGLSKIK